MLKKVMVMLASKYMAIKVRIRAVETHLMIQSLLLRDKKMVRHLFHRRKCFKNQNQPDSTEAFISNSVATTTPASLVQVAEEMEDDDVYPHSPSEDDPDPDPDPEEFHQGSVIEMVKNAKEGQGEEFILENDINKVADLFIQRFHHQIAAEAEATL